MHHISYAYNHQHIFVCMILLNFFFFIGIGSRSCRQKLYHMHIFTCKMEWEGISRGGPTAVRLSQNYSMNIIDMMALTCALQANCEQKSHAQL